MEVCCLCPSDVFDYGSILGQVLSSAGIEATFTSIRPHHEPIPAHLECDAVIVSGSEFHVYDREPWVEKLQDFVRAQLTDSVPVLGICFGHQLLADALGGTVERMPAREMGYNKIRLTAAGRTHPLMTGLENPFTCFTSHLDTVTRLPEDCVALAENSFGNHAFASSSRPAYGIQFHPEYSLSLAERLLAQKELPIEEHERISETYTVANAEASRAVRAVFTNFVDRLV